MIELPVVEIDTSRRAVLAISPAIIADLLKLPRSIRIECATINVSGDIALFLVGGELPEQSNGISEPVTLIGNVEADAGLRVTRLCWSHAPDKKWIASIDPDAKLCESYLAAWDEALLASLKSAWKKELGEKAVEEERAPSRARDRAAG